MISIDNNILSQEILNACVDRAQYGPCYIYNKRIIKDHCRLFHSIGYEPKAIHVATMANCMEGFLKVIRQSGMGVFVNTPGHLDQVEAAGFIPDEIIFTASASSKGLLEMLGKKEITVNLDSLHQIRMWKELFPKRSFGIRCNIGDSVNPRHSTGGVFLGQDSRLGLDLEEIYSLNGDQGIRGLHIYVGTNIMDISYFHDCYCKLLKLASLFPSLEYIDLGGGFGVFESSHGKDYLENHRSFDFESYNAIVCKLFNALSEEMGRPIKLVLEPGRIISAQAGFFAAQINDIKNRSNFQLLGVNASSAQFPRPLFYPEEALHPIWLVREGKIVEDSPIPTKVYGCSTYSRDYLDKGNSLSRAKIGDTLIFGNAGAYCNSAFTKFLGFHQATEYYI